MAGAVSGGDSAPQPPADDVPPEVAAMLEAAGMSAGDMPPEQLAALAAGMEGDGELSLEQVQGLFSSPGSTAASAPPIGGLITTPGSSGCSDRGWAVRISDSKMGTLDWDRSGMGMHDEGSFVLYHTPG
jgi:hypothetical protein